MLNSGDLTGDVFNVPIYIPYGDVQYLGGNASFDQININAGTLASGTLDLDLMGTNTSNLSYSFPGGFTVASGATLAVGANVPVTIQPGQTLTDNGALSFAAGDTVTMGSCCSRAGDRRRRHPDGQWHHLHRWRGSITVGSGGNLAATNSNFSISQVSLANSSVLNSGDLTGDVFNVPIYIPYGDVQYLGGNASFDQININAGTLASGTLDLDLMGTNTSNLSYSFPGGFTVASGATLAVGANVPVTIQPGQTLTDNGVLSFAAGDTVTMGSCCAGQEIAVGGTLTADGTTFTGGGGSITVGSGGNLAATNSNFSISQVSLANSSVLNSGDLTGDVFNVPIYIPYGDVQYLGGNASFDQININAGTLASGTLDLDLMGTNTSNLSYSFPGGFTVASGATLAVGANVPVTIQPGQTLTDNGASVLPPATP